MSRNLLLESGRLYAWHSSDAKSYVDISTPGIVTKIKEGGAGLTINAYLWPANDTSPNVAHCCTSLFDLANAFDCFTLSVDIKVSSSAVKASVRYDMRYSLVIDYGDQGGSGLDVSGMTEWTRVHLTVPLVQTKGKAKSSLFCVFFADDSPAGGSVQWRNMKLEVGDTGSEWTPAPEDVLLSSIPESILEPGAISTGNQVVAGQTLGNMKSSDSSWMTIRVRTKNIIPLLGNRAFYINFPTNLQCFPIYFDSSSLSIAAPCDAHTTKNVFVAPQGAVGVELVFRKSDDSAITPAEVTNVTGGGVLYGNFS